MTHGNLDPHAILHTLGLTEATAVTPVHGGSDTAIWRVEQAGEVYALRVFGQGEHSDCEREHMVMQAALVAGLPIAQVHAAGIWHDHPALLLSWLPGWPVALELCVHPWRAWNLGVVFGRMHAMIHARSAAALLHDHLDAWID